MKMLSGSFQVANIGEIIVNREERQRKRLEDIKPLADSIQRLGLIHPIVLTREGILVAGERRLSAVRLLGWDSIPFQYVDEIDPRVLSCIELEENTKRKDLSWQEVNDAMAKAYEIYREIEPEATQEAIAARMGVAQPTLSQHIEVKKARDLSTRIEGADTFRTAMTQAKALKDRRAQAEMDQYELPANPSISPILTANFNEWAPAYAGPKFNFIHCDFPYGIDADKSSANPSGYKDDLATFNKLCETLLIELDDLCAPDAHMIFWFSPTLWAETWRFLQSLTGIIENFTFDPVPLIWHKSDGQGIAPDSNRRPRRIYETAFFGWRGDRKILNLRNNLYSAPTSRLIHAHEKSEEMLHYFFQMIVDDTTRMLDPTCGSGSALRAAKTLGARSVLGLEANAEFAEAARGALR